jgi:hypothetical protein
MWFPPFLVAIRDSNNRDYRRSLRANSRGTGRDGRLLLVPFPKKQACHAGHEGNQTRWSRRTSAASQQREGGRRAAQKGKRGPDAQLRNHARQPAGAIFLSIRASHGWGYYGVLGMQEGPARPTPAPPVSPTPPVPIIQVCRVQLFCPVAHAHVPIEPPRKAARHHSAAGAAAAAAAITTAGRLACSKRQTRVDENEDEEEEGRGGVQLAHARTHQSGQDRITLLQRCAPWGLAHIIRIPSRACHTVVRLPHSKICNPSGFATRGLTLT